MQKDFYRDILYFLPYLKFAEGAAVPDPTEKTNPAVHLLDNLHEAIDTALRLNPAIQSDKGMAIINELLAEYAKGPVSLVQCLQSGQLCKILEKLL